MKNEKENGEGRRLPAMESGLSSGNAAETDQAVETRELLTPEEEKELSRRAKEGDRAARDRMVEANLRLVTSIARQYVHRGIPLQDLIQEGSIGLIRAVERFDWERGFRFSTYATWWIRQSISRAIADQARMIRLPVYKQDALRKLYAASAALAAELCREPRARELADRLGWEEKEVEALLRQNHGVLSLEETFGEEEGFTLGSILADPEGGDPESALEQKVMKSSIQAALQGLTPREREVIDRRFGLTDGVPKTLEEIGSEFQVSRERIRQIEQKAKGKLNRPFRSGPLRAFVQ